MMKLFFAACATLSLMSVTVVNGQTPQNFTLEAVLDDSNASIDSKFELEDYKGKVIVLHFLLKTECPFCLRYTNQYARLASFTPEVVHLFIKPDSKDAIRSWISQLDKSNLLKLPTIYQDPGAKLAKRFGVPGGYWFRGQSIHYPAMVVLDGEGKEMFRYVGKNNSDRMAKDDFVKKLESMTAKATAPQ